MAYLGTKPQSGFISQEANQYFTGLTQNYIDLNQSINSLSSVIILVNGVVQENSTLTLTTSSRITLGATLVASDKVTCIYLAKISSTQAPSTGSVTSDMLAGSIANSKLANSSITLNGSAVSLGGSATVDNTPQFLARSSSQSISNTTHTAVINPTEIYDSDNLYNTTDGKFTVTSSTTGYYFLIGGVGFSVSSGTRMQASFYKNGSITDGFKTESYSSSSYPGLIVSGLFNLSSSGDYVQLYCYQNTGSSKNLSGEAEKNFFGGFKIIT